MDMKSICLFSSPSRSMPQLGRLPPLTAPDLRTAMAPCLHNSMSTTSFDRSPLRPHQTHTTMLAVHSQHYRPFTATSHGRSQNLPKVQTVHEDRARRMQQERAKRSSTVY